MLTLCISKLLEAMYMHACKHFKGLASPVPQIKTPTKYIFLYSTEIHLLTIKKWQECIIHSHSCSKCMFTLYIVDEYHGNERMNYRWTEEWDWKLRVSWQLDNESSIKTLWIYVTVVYFTLQTELLKSVLASLSMYQIYLLQCTQSAHFSLQKFSICLLIYPLQKIVQCDATKPCPKHSVPCSA